jgi:hypothetical protein
MVTRDTWRESRRDAGVPHQRHRDQRALGLRRNAEWGASVRAPIAANPLIDADQLTVGREADQLTVGQDADQLTVGREAGQLVVGQDADPFAVGTRLRLPPP